MGRWSTWTTTAANCNEEYDKSYYNRRKDFRHPLYHIYLLLLLNKQSNLIESNMKIINFIIMGMNEIMTEDVKQGGEKSNDGR